MITLEELLNITNENANIVIYQDTEEVSRYDGKNSIPEELNDCEVIDQYPWVDSNGDLWLCIEIDTL